MERSCRGPRGSKDLSVRRQAEGGAEGLGWALWLLPLIPFQMSVQGGGTTFSPSPTAQLLSQDLPINKSRHLKNEAENHTAPHLLIKTNNIAKCQPVSRLESLRHGKAITQMTF